MGPAIRSKKNLVEILMATFEGSAFLEEQLESLLDQTYSHWNLVIRDDGSSDDTLPLIHSYAARYPGKIRVVDSHTNKRGPCRNFTSLLEFSTAPYTMFCDQDDVWFREKIEMSLEEMQRLEGLFGQSCPLLVHTDLQVVNEHLDIIADSYWEHQNLSPNKFLSLNRLLVQNGVTGCATMINGSLRDPLLPIPAGAIMHDWWTALVASAFGKIGFIDRPALKYRQHDRNEVGAKRWGWRFIRSRLSDPGEIRHSLRNTQIQAEAFLERYVDRLSPDQYKLVKDYATLDSQTFWGRRSTILRAGYFKNGLLRNVGLLTFV